MSNLVQHLRHVGANAEPGRGAAAADVVRAGAPAADAQTRGHALRVPDARSMRHRPPDGPTAFFQM